MLTYYNQRNRWHAHHLKPPAPEVQHNIIQLIETASTTQQRLVAYRTAELAGMVYFQLSDKPGESDWVWT